MTSEMKVLFLGCRAVEGDPPEGRRAAAMAHQLRPRMNREGNRENQSVGEEGQVHDSCTSLVTRGAL